MSEQRSESNIHQIAVSGFGEGTNDIYDAVRPSYPATSLNYIHKTISFSSSSSPSSSFHQEGEGKGKGKGWTILEPGSGTGIFSRLLLSPPPPSSITGGLGGVGGGGESGKEEKYPSFEIEKLIGIEPSEGMRKAWYKGLEKLPPVGNGKIVESVQGGFDDFSNVQKLGIEKGQVDAVIIAQAYHWCQDHEKALRNIASYLRPGAPLILIWNNEGYTPQWQTDLREAFQPFDLGTPQQWKGWWRAAFDTVAYKEDYEEKIEWRTDWSIGITEDQLVDRIFSKSYLTPVHLTGLKRQRLDQVLRAIIRNAPHEWIDKERGVFKYNYLTEVVVLRRKN